MRTRFAGSVAVAVVGLFALTLVPRGSSVPGRLAAAGSDVPVWGFAVVGVVLLAGIALVVLGLLRRRHGEATRAAEQAPEDEA